MEKIKVVHFGIAHDHSEPTILTAKKYPEIFEIVGICEPDEKIRKEFGERQCYNGIPFLTEEEVWARKDIKAAFCEGHELQSVAHAQKCIDHGLHVHLDKPGGESLAAFEKLVNDAKAKELTLQMGYMYRYNPAMKYIVKSFNEGKYGKITGIDTSFGVAHVEEKRKWLAQFKGGMMFFLGGHIIDMIMLICGEPSGVSPFNHSSDWNNNGSLDTGLAVLDYPGFACTVRSNATENNGYESRRIRVMGTLGTVEVRPLETPTIVRESLFDECKDYQWKGESHSVNIGYIPGRFDEMMLEFAKCINGEIKNPYSAEYEIAVQRTLLKACGIEK